MLRLIEIIIISVIAGSALGLLLHRWLFNLGGEKTKSNPSESTENHAVIYAHHDNPLPNIEGLLIQPEELIKLTAIKKPETLTKPKNYYWKQAIIISTLLIILLTITDNLTVNFGLYAIMPLLGSLILLLLHLNQDKQQVRYSTLIGLLKEVSNYNQIVQHIRVLDQLKAVGHPVDLEDRSRIIEALTLTRQDLIRALNTERIFRENPEFNPAHFEIDLTGLESLQVNEKTSEYSELLETALKVSVRLQEEMKKLRL